MAEKDYTQSKSGLPWDKKGDIFFMKDRFSFAATPLANADSAKLFAIPAGCEVRNVWVKIVTPEGSAIAFTIGSAAGGTQFEGDGAAGAAAGTVTRGVGGTDAGVTANGVFYAADGFIYLDAAADLDELVIDVVAEVAKIF